VILAKDKAGTVPSEVSQSFFLLVLGDLVACQSQSDDTIGCKCSL